MNLLSTFPEINDFFKKSEFSELELISLLKQIETTYTDKIIRKAAKSLIDLELHKYEIEKNVLTDEIKDTQSKYTDIEKLKKLNVIQIAGKIGLDISEFKNYLKNNKLRIKDTRLLNDIEFKKIEKFLKSRLEIINNNDKKNEDELLKLKKLNVDEIAKSIGWSYSKFDSFLKRKNIIKTNTCFLNDNEFEKIKEMLNSCLKACSRIEKKNKQLEQVRVRKNKMIKSIYNGNDVYAKIAKIGLGKVIYIRKS